MNLIRITLLSNNQSDQDDRRKEAHLHQRTEQQREDGRTLVCAKILNCASAETLKVHDQHQDRG